MKAHIGHYLNELADKMCTFALQHGSFKGTLPPAPYAVIKAAVEKRVETDALRFILENIPSSETITQLRPFLQDSTIAKACYIILMRRRSFMACFSRRGLRLLVVMDCRRCSARTALKFGIQLHTASLVMIYQNSQPFRNWSNWHFCYRLNL